MGAQYQQRQQGFTIVETTLFMAISALLAVLLLGGWSVMINTQHYKDSVRTLQTFIQQQYGLVLNVENGRSNNLSCVLNGATYTIDDVPLTNTKRGQSNCAVMGRYIHIHNGMNVDVTSIVGVEGAKPPLIDDGSDIASINSFAPVRVDHNIGLTNDELEIPWQANVIKGGGDTSTQDYSIAIIRTPRTGTVHTFIVAGPSEPAVADMIDVTNEDEHTLCLDPGDPITGGGQGIIIRKFASAQSAIETLSSGAGSC